MKYRIERDVSLRVFEILGEVVAGIVTEGVVKGEEYKGLRNLNKVFIPDSLLIEMGKRGILARYVNKGVTQ